jgi:hypothetical protein
VPSAREHIISITVARGHVRGAILKWQKVFSPGTRNFFTSCVWREHHQARVKACSVLQVMTKKVYSALVWFIIGSETKLIFNLLPIASGCKIGILIEGRKINECLILVPLS